MTREELIREYVLPACRNTWNDKICKEIERALEQEPCDDAISRDELLKAIDTWDKFGCDANTKLVPYQNHYVPYIHYDDVVKCIKGMPSVNPQSKIGHWIRQDNTKEPLYGWYFCSECNSVIGDMPKFCSNCGARMESEGTDADSY